ncbi:hypothetical protein ULMS_06370 [Patiriisocius marinistellae]|uniref:NADPH--hemoprotein reductase n=1 Tax=Patiriisocius marinistellae TaxID=2494560 RepID=A0A5J4FYA4_9FLAO|nr:PepSY domain-containing protein [Patiriisocius marinistellae]GEQ85129.1 hypothetical protein ULMS_06370 [Patiriisocius marinistellae]
MTLSIWRYSHLALAVSSALFLIIASFTGVILAFEPISQSVQPYAVANLNEISVSKTIEALQQEYTEVLEFELTADDFVIASVVTQNGETESIYVHPITGRKLGEVKAKTAFFNWVTNVHRSLFLKGIGRFFIGLVSLLLCLISLTGILLLAKRQGGFLKLYSRIKETNFAQRYHIILGRWLLIPIVIIAATGVYLSAEKFSLLPSSSTTHDWSAIPSETELEKPLSEFDVFRSPLNDLKKLTFPFSEDEEDYFIVALKNKEVLVHQFTGEIMSDVPYPFVAVASQLSLNLHTGQGSILWSLVLIIASGSILFFIVSGFSMTLKRRKNIKLQIPIFNKDESEFIILVGSESGNTFLFAQAFQKALVATDKKVFLSSLNEYTTYKKATNIIVFTATYGDGEAPTNARKFTAAFQGIQPLNNIKFSIVGFGSLLYPHYCKFAIQVDALLHQHLSFKPLHPLVKINDQSNVAFQSWLKEWNELMGLNIQVTFPKRSIKQLKVIDFSVVDCTKLNIDNTFLLRLRPKKKIKFQSGDLLLITPPDSNVSRKYSIARVENEILLSVKWHPHGICSSYLCDLKYGDIVRGSVEKNDDFHFPKSAPSVFMIGNGTGITPFLGMLQERKNIPTHMLWGGRNVDSFDYYRPFVERKLIRTSYINASFNTQNTYDIVLSQVNDKCYVQDMLLQQQKMVAKTLKDGGVLMLCGSMTMQQSVLDTLEKILEIELQQPLSDFELNGQLLMDCY